MLPSCVTVRMGQWTCKFDEVLHCGLMLELEDALARILALVPSARPELIALDIADKRILAQDIPSPRDLPGFDNSAMDGYAVIAADLRTASASSPVKLRMAGKVAAGETFAGELAAGTCVRVFTGSSMPTGADSVIMQEDTKIDPTGSNQILALDSTKPWENVRFKGEDVRTGALLAKQGEVLHAGGICLLAAAGIHQVAVGSRPTVGVIATGSELREANEHLGPGQVYESNRIGLATLIRGAGASPLVFPIVADNMAATEKALSEAFSNCDIVVSAGGASVGELDLIKPALSNLGGQLDFWRVAIKPGRPFLCGRLHDKLLFGLPGNPVSTLVTFLLLVRPVLRRWQGALKAELPIRPGILDEDLVNPGSRRHFVRVRISDEGKVSPTGAQASHLLSSFAQAHGLVDVPPSSTLSAGTSVPVRIWEL